MKRHTFIVQISLSLIHISLIAMSDVNGCDFGKHIIPYCHENGRKLVAYEYNGYWKDVGTLGSYWEANMELIDIIPEFNLYEEYWKIYTKSDIIPPQYVSPEAKIFRSIIGDGCEIYGEVENSVIGAGVTIEKGAVVRNSIIMKETTIGEGAVIDKAIIAENVEIGKNVVLGVGEEVPNKVKPVSYTHLIIELNSLFPEGDHMNPLFIHTNQTKNTTILQNQFIDQYMASANGEYVKLYLYPVSYTHLRICRRCVI